MDVEKAGERTLPVWTVPGLTWYTAATVICVIPQRIKPVMRKTRRRPILEMTQLFTMMAKTPTAVKMHEFIKGLPTLAIWNDISFGQKDISGK